MVEVAVARAKSTTDRARTIPVPVWLRATMRAASTVSPRLAARVARSMFFTPPRPRIRDRERAVLAQARTFSINAYDHRVTVYTWGEGPVMLLVHGWGGHAGHMAGMVDPLVQAGYRVVAPDLPGHGRSEGRHSSLVHGAATIQEIDGLFGSFAGLVAHSFGAGVATWAMHRGLDVPRAVYVAPASTFQPYWDRFRLSIGITQRVMDQMVDSAQKWLAVSFDGMAALDLAPDMKTPLLVVHSVDDRETDAQEGRLLAERWPNTELRLVDGLGHLRILWDDAVIEEVVRFAAPAC